MQTDFLTEGCSLQVDADGVALLTLDMPAKVNVMNEVFMDAMEAALGVLENPASGLRGVILTSAKSSFVAGGDLAYMLRAQPGQETMVTSYFERLKASLRRLEKLPFPVVAAINGTALGGGYELCLACHYRVALQSDKTVIGLPEVQFGILPAAGGVVRLTRLLGIEAALPFLVTGRRVSVQSALANGLIDEVAPTSAAMLAAARARILTHAHRRQVWDRNPTPAAALGPVASPAGVDAREEAVMEITAIAKLAATADVDAALREETHGMVRLVLGATAKQRIGEFFKMQAAARPQQAEASTA